jgi:NAD-dependent DNA ligase
MEIGLLIVLLIAAFFYLSGKKTPTTPEPTAKHTAKTRTADPDEITITYVDAEGVQSTRRVIFRRHDNERFDAFCLKRRALRTFRYDRLIAIVDASGKPINLQQWIAAKSSKRIKQQIPTVPKVRTAKRNDIMVVLFTGFAKADLLDLQALAKDNGLKVSAARKITKSTDYLVAGNRAGPKKLQDAAYMAIPVLTKEQFYTLLETGEVQAC